ncbi:MAG: hypothetical protein K0R54_4338 [Clostridiaceae bacterium]|jgi:hypothetical protein|nr:hypothetical protein [Clostridiaceae bacterium]
MNKKYYENLKVRCLKIDPLVQGSLQIKRVNNIVENFDSKFVGIIIVSKRANGEYFVMDGFHRSTALKKLNIEEVFCEIHEGITLEDEANYYLAHNKHRKNPRAVDDYKVSITAKVPEVIAVENILRELEIEVSESGFRSPKTALDIYKNYGIDITKKCIKLYADAWGKKTLIGKYLKVLAKFIKINEEQIDISILSNSMKKYKFLEVDESINQMLLAKTVTSAVKGFESLLYYMYNNGLPKHKRLDYIPIKLKV